MAYRIQRGDTLWELANRFGTSVSALAKANGIKNASLIRTGAMIRIPGRGDSFKKAPAAPKNTGGKAPSSATSKQRRLADVARRVATRMNSRGWCARGVFNSLAAAGMPIRRSPSAWMAANTLAHDKRFREVRLTDAQIRRLPPGCIVVTAAYNRPGNPHGHIAITLGNGREASDHVQSLSTLGRQRVFIPV